MFHSKIRELLQPTGIFRLYPPCGGKTPACQMLVASLVARLGSLAFIAAQKILSRRRQEVPETTRTHHAMSYVQYSSSVKRKRAAGMQKELPCTIGCCSLSKGGC